MHLKMLSFVLSAVILLSIETASAQTVKVTDEYIQKEISRGKQYFFVLLKRGNTQALDSLATAQIQQKHLQHLFTLKQEGKLPIFGPFMEDGDLRGICIFNSADKSEVIKLVEEDPFVKSGRLIYEIHPWFSLPGDKLPL
jgi:uncharacterized protein